MAQVERVLETIKRTLKARGLRYRDLARAVGVSEPTVKRWLARGGITIERLEAICDFLELDFFELARLSRQRSQLTRELDVRDERILAAEPRLLAMLHLLCSGWSVAEIRESFAVGEAQSTRLLARLDRMGLIELLPRDRVRLRVARDLAWRSDGPVMQKYARAALAEFLAGRFDAPNAVLKLEVRELAESSIVLLRRRIDRIAREFVEVAQVDAAASSSARRRSVGLVLAMRPWRFSLVDSLGPAVARGERRADVLGRRVRA
jgi:transcriptional regulator with XRE-family HTH domain